MAQVIKVANGETIQVRTGVLQGIGPAGPTGPTGPSGPQGEQGPQGEPGPMGQINQQCTQLKVASTQSITSDVTTSVTWSSGAYAVGSHAIDELGIVTSNTTFTAPAPMDIFYMVWVQFAAPTVAESWFHVEVYSATQGVLASQSTTQTSDTGQTVDLNLTTTATLAAGEVVNIRVRQSNGSALNLLNGRLAMYRIGAGPKGDQGIQGPTGPQGPTGATGAQGPTGNANSGYTTYAGIPAP